MRKKALMEKKAGLLAWLGLPYLDAAEDYQKKEEEISKEVRDLELSAAE